NFRLKTALRTKTHTIGKRVVFIGWRALPLPVRDARLRGSASVQNLRLSFWCRKRVSKTRRQIKSAARAAKYPEVFLRATGAKRDQPHLDRCRHHRSALQSGALWMFHFDQATFAMRQSRPWPDSR